MKNINENRQNSVEGLVEFAGVQLFQASMAPENERGSLLAEAKDALFRAEQAQKGVGSWRLACISGFEGNAALCVKWLKRAQDNNTLPEREVLEKEPYLKAVRGTKQFKEFLKTSS